ncbi:hypothetical protein FWF89_03820 [Candidatus Saccharibacteria bacterium]|nr:hypothetical protein [Candidatus Saccharibacteria bacterium]
MPEPTSSFESDFVSQVKSPNMPVNAALPGTSMKKGGIDKRWFIIGGLILLVVGALVFVTMMSRGDDGEAEEEAGVGDEFVDDTTLDPASVWSANPYRGDIVGIWKCNAEIVLEFRSDQSYIWKFGLEDNNTEIGRFWQEQSEARLVVAPQNSGSEPYGLYLFGDDRAVIFMYGDTAVYRCERSSRL